MNNCFAFLRPISEQETVLQNRRKAPESREVAPTRVRDIPAMLQAGGNLAVQHLFRSGAVQTKLAISQPGDPEEQEADRVAEQVVSSGPVATIERKSAVGGSACPKCEEEEKLRRKEKPSRVHQATAAVHSPIASQHGGGQPLPPSVQAFFEPRFGADFSLVRVHTDGEAAESTKAIQARAFTSGKHLVFAPGEFMPESRDGRKLLAHELAHVVQRGEASETTTTTGEMVTPVFRQTAASPGTPGGPDPCFDLLQQIIDLLNVVADLFNNALDDKWDLFKYHPERNPEHPEKGTWDGHRDNYKETRERLRQKIAEWESKDDCRAYRLSKQQQEELKEAEEFKEKEFPQKPAKSMRDAPEAEGESVWDKLRKYLPEILVGALIAIEAYFAGAAIVACFASGACEIGLALAGLGFLLVLGITAALKAAGVQDKPSNAPVASSEKPQDDKNQVV